MLLKIVVDPFRRFSRDFGECANVLGECDVRDRALHFHTVCLAAVDVVEEPFHHWPHVVECRERECAIRDWCAPDCDPVFDGRGNGRAAPDCHFDVWTGSEERATHSGVDCGIAVLGEDEVA